MKMQHAHTHARTHTHTGHNEQLYSSASDTEKTNKQKTIYTKHQNTIDMQDYQAVTCVQLTKQTVDNALRLQKQQMLQRGQGKLV